MNAEKFACDFLEKNGMYFEDAETVVTAMRSDDFYSTSIKWTDDINGYPDVFKAALMLSVKSFALRWIDAHMPQAWYREMFV